MELNTINNSQAETAVALGGNSDELQTLELINRRGYWY
jgi:hypothetical protein